MTGDAGTPPGPPAPTGGSGPKDWSEKQKERYIFWRVFFLVFGTHIFAGFIWLLFYLGGHRM